MELKARYKQTEIGIIPEEWETKPLGNFITLQRGHDLTNRQRKRGTVPVMGSAGQNGFHDTALTKGPGVIIGRSGASFGQAHYCDEDYWPHNTALYVTDFRESDRLFVFYFLRYLDFSRHNSGGAQQSLNRNFIYPIIIAVPPVYEQRAIAVALFDMDALIASLDRMIAKKRDIKQATMQELLTGKRRLAGFSGEWEVRKFGEVVERIVGGGTPSRTNPAFWGDEIPWATVKDFSSFTPYSTQESITKEGLKNSASNLIPKGTVITSTRMALGKAVIYNVDVSINQDLKAIFLNSDLENEFLYYWFEVHAGHLEGMGSGSTVMGISLSDLRKVPFYKPPLSEQTAIATILSDMDADIATTEQRLDKTRQLKQGMMQELLTGRIRLV